MMNQQKVDELYEVMRAAVAERRDARQKLSVAQRQFAARRNAEKITSKNWCAAAEALRASRGVQP